VAGAGGSGQVSGRYHRAMILAHDLLGSGERWMLVLHGILGRRSNWRSFTRRWLESRPGWGAVLVDLREHGDSQGFPPPHTVTAAAHDLVELRAALESEQGGRVAGVMGHSFGGKVALAGAAALREAGEPLDELWIIDAPVGPRQSSREALSEGVIATLESLAPSFASRKAFIAALGDAGISKPTAQWLAMNLVEGDDAHWRFALKLDHIRALIADFAQLDLWPTLDAELDAGLKAGLVIADRSEAVSPEERQRAQTFADQGRLKLEVIKDAGHWVHVDAPKQLLEILKSPP
jgi:pimeloyl-ACP methyl ester carboxylesterase